MSKLNKFTKPRWSFCGLPSLGVKIYIFYTIWK